MPAHEWTDSDSRPVIPTIPRPRPPQDQHRSVVAVGMIRRHNGRTLRITATHAGVTGLIQRQGGAR